MKNKNTTLRCSLLIALSVFKIGSSVAQMVGTDAYMKGNSVEIGLDGLGGFEGSNTASSPPPAGMHFRSSTGYFGFVSNPQLNAWATYDGDFFTPGTPENGWGFEIGVAGGISKGNNCSIPNEIPGSITSWSYLAPQTSCDWEGNFSSGTDLHFKIDYQLQDADLFYITTVSITNNTAVTIPDLYYYRNLDPDNNEMLSSDFTTQNTIDSQIMTGGSNTSVTATSALPWTSSYTLLAVDSNWVADYGGFTNRDASDLYTGTGFTQTVGATNFADEAISLAYKITNLAPSATQTFKFASIFDPISIGSAVSALNLSTLSTNDMGSLQNDVKVYPNPFSNNTTFAIGRSVQLKNTGMHVYDILGKEVVTVLDIQTHEFKLEKNDLPNGIYLYKINNDGNQIGSGKLIIK